MFPTGLHQMPNYFLSNETLICSISFVRFDDYIKIFCLYSKRQLKQASINHLVGTVDGIFVLAFLFIT